MVRYEKNCWLRAFRSLRLYFLPEHHMRVCHLIVAARFSRWVITGISIQISMKHTLAWSVIGMKTKPSLLFGIHMMNLRWSLPTKRTRMGNGGIWLVLPLDTVIVFLVRDQSLSRNRHSELRINWIATWWFTARPPVFRGITLSVWKYLYSNNKNSGGGYRNRTGVHGFAIRCVTTPPTRRRLTLCYTMI